MWEHFLLETQNRPSKQWSKDSGLKEALVPCNFLREFKRHQFKLVFNLQWEVANVCWTSTTGQPPCSALYIEFPHHHHNDFARMEVSSTFYSWGDYGSDRLSNLLQVTQKEAVKQGFKSHSVQPQRPGLFPQATITHIGWAPHQALDHQLPVDGLCWTWLRPEQPADSEQLLVESELVCEEIVTSLGNQPFNSFEGKGPPLTKPRETEPLGIRYGWSQSMERKNWNPRRNVL